VIYKPDLAKAPPQKKRRSHFMETLSPLSIPHATQLSNGEGWVLAWDNGLNTQFEVTCHSKNPQQIQAFEKLISQGHQKALTELSN
jgi:hypothetical protein